MNVIVVRDEARHDLAKQRGIDTLHLEISVRWMHNPLEERVMTSTKVLIIARIARFVFGASVRAFGAVFALVECIPQRTFDGVPCSFWYMDCAEKDQEGENRVRRGTRVPDKWWVEGSARAYGS